MRFSKILTAGLVAVLFFGSVLQANKLHDIFSGKQKRSFGVDMLRKALEIGTKLAPSGYYIYSPLTREEQKALVSEEVDGLTPLHYAIEHIPLFKNRDEATEYANMLGLLFDATKNLAPELLTKKVTRKPPFSMNEETPLQTALLWAVNIDQGDLGQRFSRKERGMRVKNFYSEDRFKRDLRKFPLEVMALQLMDESLKEELGRCDEEGFAVAHRVAQIAVPSFENFSREAIQTLKDKGVDLNARDEHYMRAIDYAANPRKNDGWQNVPIGLNEQTGKVFDELLRVGIKKPENAFFGPVWMYGYACNISGNPMKRHIDFLIKRGFDPYKENRIHLRGGTFKESLLLRLVSEPNKFKDATESEVIFIPSVGINKNPAAKLPNILPSELNEYNFPESLPT